MMEGPRSRKYLNIHRESSLTKVSSPPSIKRPFVRNTPRLSNHPHFVSNSRSSSRTLNVLNLPLHPKRSHKTSSPKRTQSGNESDRPSKLQKLQTQVPTGLEECGILDDASEKVAATEITDTDLLSYTRRAKVATYTQGIGKKRELSNRIRSDWNDMPSRARRGLSNLTGVLCYRNSLFQALLHSPKFSNWFVKYHKAEDCVEDDQENCIACKLRNFVQAYWTGKHEDTTKAAREINKVFKINKWAASGDDPHGQGDPEEQYSWILKLLSEKLPKRAYRLLEATNHLVTDSCIKCNSCSYVSKTVGHITGPISVPLRPRIKDGNLSHYLNSYMKEKINDYKCEKCHDKRDKSRYQEITHSPDTLLVQLKRFDWDGRKDSFPVSFDTSLSLDEYCSSDNQEPSQYELSAVILHRGSTGSGHYICQAKGEDGSWVEFDDHSASKVSLKTVLNAKGTGFTPYLLFFQRKEN